MLLSRQCENKVIKPDINNEEPEEVIPVETIETTATMSLVDFLKIHSDKAKVIVYLVYIILFEILLNILEIKQYCCHPSVP